MIDYEGRGKARQAVERFASGITTNDEFEEEFPRGDPRDRALKAIRTMIWNLYDDHKVYTLSGAHAPNMEQASLLRRCQAFLSSDLEYRWPIHNFMKIAEVSAFLNWLSFGRINERLAAEAKAEQEQLASAGDMSVWPFLNRDELLTHGKATSDPEVNST